MAVTRPGWRFLHQCFFLSLSFFSPEKCDTDKYHKRLMILLVGCLVVFFSEIENM